MMRDTAYSTQYRPHTDSDILTLTTSAAADVYTIAYTDCVRDTSVMTLTAN